jgi:outer membrane murein-binding lipoprotein Lpp
MKTLSVAILLTAGLLVSGCWDTEKEKRAANFMSTLSKCDDCKLDKPLLGPKKEAAP